MAGSRNARPCAPILAKHEFDPTDIFDIICAVTNASDAQRLAKIEKQIRRHIDAIYPEDVVGWLSTEHPLAAQAACLALAMNPELGTIRYVWDDQHEVGARIARFETVDGSTSFAVDIHADRNESPCVRVCGPHVNSILHEIPLAVSRNGKDLSRHAVTVGARTSLKKEGHRPVLEIKTPLRYR